jgi:hypothetical protein
MNRAIALHRVCLMIGRSIPFADARNARRRFEKRGHLGKVVVYFIQ